MAAAELRKIAPHSGSYCNEGNFFNASWREEFWGENYSKLRAIKTKFDPDGLFFFHHGVGSEEWSADGFTRLSQWGFRGSTHTAAMQVLVLVTTIQLSAVDLPQSGRLRPVHRGR